MLNILTNLSNIIIDRLTNINLSILVVTFLALFSFIYFMTHEYYTWYNASMSISGVLRIERDLRLIAIPCAPTITLFIYELLNYFTGYNNFVFFEILILISFGIAVIYAIIATITKFTPTPKMFNS